MVETPIFELAGTTDFLNELKKTDSVLQPRDMADGVVYILSTPPHVQVPLFLTRIISRYKIKSF